MAKSNSKALKLIDSKSYGYFSALYRSFYSSNLYVDVGMRWKGLGLIYLLFIVFVFSIPIQFIKLQQFSRFYDHQVEAFKLIPTVYIQEGIVRFNQPMPYEVKDRDGNVRVIVDTTGAIKQIDEVKYPFLTVLLTKDSLIYKLPLANILGSRGERSKMLEEKLTPDMTQVFNGQEWIDESRLNLIKLVSMALIPISIFSFYWGLSLVLLLSYSIVGSIIAWMFFDYKMPYKQSNRVMMVAATPLALFFFMVLTTGIKIPFAILWMVGILTFYFCFGVLSLKRASRKVAIR